jgi:hypothetical protein
MEIEVGKLYKVPSGMGGSFTIRVLRVDEATKQGDGTPVKERVTMRVHMPGNRDWHNYIFSLNRDYFEQHASEV